MVERVRIDGLSEILTKLQSLPNAVAKSTLRRVGKKVLQPIADRAEELAPKLSGELKRSITVSTRLSRRQYSLHRKEAGTDVEIFAGPGALPQATLQEFGTSEFPPKPFMRPAWDGGRAQLLADIKLELWSEVRRALERNAVKTGD